MEVYHNRPNFADADAQEDARQRLTHVRRVALYILCVALSTGYLWHLSPCVLGFVASPSDNVHKERLSVIQSNIFFPCFIFLIYFRKIKYL